MNSRKTYLLVVLLILLQPSFGQSDKNQKKIIKYEGTIVKSVSCLNKEGNVIFWKKNNIPISLGAIYYDASNNRIKSISAHANVGFSVWTYEFDSFGNEVRIYAHKKPDSVVHKSGNDYSYDCIKNIMSRLDLEKDSTVFAIMNNDEKYLLFERKFDMSGNMLEEILFEENGDTAHITTNILSKNGTRTRFHYNGTIGEWNIYYSYDINGNELSRKRVNRSGDTTEVYINKYDKYGNRIKTKYLYRGKPQYTERFFFQDGQLMIRKVRNSKGKLLRKEAFEYDEYGNVILEKYQGKGGKKKAIYNWVYEYY